MMEMCTVPYSVCTLFRSKPYCTDIMEIYNAVENMEYTEDEVI